MTTERLHLAGKRGQAGFTLVEMMVALAIGLIVMLGFASLFVNMKQTFNSQDKLAQLQDNERLAMTILTASIQEAGYFPSPATLTSAQILPTTSATYGPMASTQAIMGVTGSGAVPESISTAFAASANDELVTCQGHIISAADVAAAPGAANGSVSVRNSFFVDAATNTLQCETMINGSTASSYGGGTHQPLITNVQSMTVLYGMDAGNGSVNTYLTASAVTNWSKVITARVTLNFLNPNDPAHPIAWVQTINLLNH